MKISEWFYRLLLRLYPRDHRRRYGELMLIHFRDQLRDAQTAGALLHLWVRTLRDVLVSAPREHAEAAQRQNVYTWPEVLLAVLPGVLPFLLPPQPDRIESLVLVGLGAAYLGLLLLYLWQKRPAAWTLPLLGLAGTYVVLSIFMLLGTSRWFGANMMPLLFLLAATVLLLRRHNRVDKRASLLPFALLCALTLGALLWFGAGSTVARAEALEAPALILLMALLGLPFARRYGLLGALFVTGSAYWAIESTIDPSLQLRFGSWPHLLSLANLVTALIIIPILALRARSARGRVRAILVPLGLYLILLIVLPPFVYAVVPQTVGSVDAAALVEQAAVRAAYALQIVAGTAFALSLYGAEPRMAHSAVQASEA